MQRRSFLKAGLATGALGLLGTRSKAFAQRSSAPTVSTGLARFVDPLPIPGTIRPAGIQRIAMSEFYTKMHRDLPPTKVWGYNGTCPGPTIEVRRGAPAAFRWDNNLPPTHLLH